MSHGIHRLIGCILDQQNTALQCSERYLPRALPDQAFEEDVVRPERIASFTTQALSNVAWAFAALRYYPAGALPAVIRELHARMDQLSEQARAACAASHPSTDPSLRDCTCCWS